MLHCSVGQYTPYLIVKGYFSDVQVSRM